MNIIHNIVKSLDAEQIRKINRISKQYKGGDDEGLWEWMYEVVIENITGEVLATDAPNLYLEVYAGDTIEVILHESKKGWIPSVHSDGYVAPYSTIDEDLATETKAEAFVWGLGDALTAHLLENGIN